ncbi:hypothetical protein RDWZM_000147 [Blomia tropicalis]|uniref:GTF3C1 extended winged-helix domain-containing protein n=1 Tax=Blomia tropicalis TaxID=40697 RepID=A0A9Q0M9K2_BLOTA|nr:hypothetical protein RDWZM_000147 [Blomia tropicalis]
MNESMFLTIRDEIALEGLDGITFESLWIRLIERKRFLNFETNQSNIEYQIDEKFMNYVYRIVTKDASNGKVDFFKLPKPRAKLVIFNRCESFNEETGTLMYDEQQVPEDIYSPLVCVDDDKIRGSCLNYKTRINVTKSVLELDSFVKFKNKFNEAQVVIVANQETRAYSILGPIYCNAYLEFKSETYCILEYIARKRHYGYLNSKVEGMRFKDSRARNSFYYYRYQLLKMKIVVQFPVYFYDFKRRLCNNSFVLFIPRFKPYNVNPIDWKATIIGNIFVDAQISKITFSELKCKTLQLKNIENQAIWGSKIDPKKFREFLSRYSNVFSIHKNEEAKDWDIEFLQPLNRPLSNNDLYPSSSEITKSSGASEGDDDDDDDDGDVTLETICIDSNKDDLNKESPISDLDRKYVKFKCHQIRRYFVEKIYLLVEHSGTSGITRTQLLRMVDVPNYMIRRALKLLLNEFDMIKFITKQIGRQKTYLYVAKRHTVNDNIDSDHNTSTLSSSMALSDLNRNRLEFIHDFIATHKFVDNLFTIRRHLLNKECEAGIKFRIDVKTIARLVYQLAQANFIIIRSYRLLYDQFSRNVILLFYNQNLIEHNYDDSREKTIVVGGYTYVLDKNNRRYASSIEDHLLLRNKFHYYSHQQVDLQSGLEITPIEIGIQPSGRVGSLFDSLQQSNQFDSDESMELWLNQSGSITDRLFVIQQPLQAKKLYGFKRSKIERSFIFFKYLFYILVDDSSTDDDYILQTDWRYQIPKLCRIFRDNECSLLDIMMYIPISIFRDIYQIPYIIPGLEELLRDPIRQHQLLYQVDPLIRRYLLFNRKAIGIIYELLEFCINFGLIQISDRVKIQLSVSIQFKILKEVQFPRPLVEGYDSMQSSAILNKDGSVQYRFLNIRNFDRFVEDVESHLDEKYNCTPEKCPFDEKLRIHSVPGFKPKPNQTKDNIKSKRLKRKKIDSECGESMDEEVYDESDYDSNAKHIEGGSKKRKIKNEQSTPKLKLKKMKSDKTNKPAAVKVNTNKKLMKRVVRKSSTTDAIEDAQKKFRRSKIGTRLLRQYWTREEDHFILKCRIASLLLDPNSNKICISRSELSSLLHEHVGSKSYTKDGDTCSRRLCKFSKRPYIQRIIAFALHELDYIDVSTIRPENQNDCEAMFDAFKVVLEKVLAHKFQNTEFFMSKNELKTMVKVGSEMNESNQLDEQKLSLENINELYDIIDLYRTESKNYYLEPKNFYDIHAYVITNLLISSLISLKSLQTPQSTNLDQASTLKTKSNNDKSLTQRKYFMRTVFKSLKHFPEQLVNLVTRRMLQNDMIKRNKKNSPKQKPNCYAYSISQNFYSNLRKFYIQLTSFTKQSIADKNHLIQPNETKIVDDNNSLFNSLHFIECLSSDVLGYLDVFNPMDEFKQAMNFKLEIPEHFMTIPDKYLNSRHVSRSMMLFRNTTTNSNGESETFTEKKNVQNVSSRYTDSMFINHIKVQVERGSVSSFLMETHQSAINIIQYHLPQSIIQLIRSKNEMGIKLNNLVESFEPNVYENELIKFLDFLEIKRIIFSVGIVEKTLVHRDSVRYWLVHSYENLDQWSSNTTSTENVPDFVNVETEYSNDNGQQQSSNFQLKQTVEVKQICFLPKLWKLPNGGLDLETLTTYFTLILGHLIFVNSMATEKSLIDAFDLLIPPVQLIELLDLLTIIECVRKSITPAYEYDQCNQFTSINDFNDFFTLYHYNNDNSFTENNSGVSTPSEVKEPKLFSKMESLKTTYEATINSYSKLTLFCDKLKEVYGTNGKDMSMN